MQIENPMSLPHACGGVSHFPVIHWRQQPSSPRLWGCFFFAYICALDEGVFPTPVGVFPGSFFRVISSESLPHACGGVSR